MPRRARRRLRRAPSVPIPKFASACGISGANFGIKRDTSTFLILVRVLNLKFLHERAGNNDRNFKFTAPDGRAMLTHAPLSPRLSSSHTDAKGRRSSERPA